MKLSSLAIASCLLCLLHTSTAQATPPDVATQQQVDALVQAKLLQPLKKRDDERSRFSRARMPPSERRVRVLDVEVDTTGATFVRFAIDTRGGIKQTWQPDTIVGCAYPERGAVFASITNKPNAEVRDAAVLLGKKGTKAPDATCVAR